MSLVARERMESWLRPLLRQRPWLAVAVGILRDGETQVESLGACEERSVFAIASITKTFTGLALARLVTDGRIELQAPLRRYLKESKLPRSASREMTLLDLATHHSGLPQMPRSRPSPDFRDPFLGYEERHLYAALREHGSSLPADSRYSYSNLGYKALGLAMERAAGEPFADLMQRSVLDPLGLHETTFADPPSLIQGRDLLGVPTPVWHFSRAMAASGGLRSTLPDVLQYLQAWLTPPAAMAGAMDLACQPVHPLADGGAIGLGWHRNASGQYWHSGALTGFSTWAMFDLAKQTACVVLANQFTPHDPIGEAVAKNVEAAMHGGTEREVTGSVVFREKAKHIALRLATPLRRLRS